MDTYVRVTFNSAKYRFENGNDDPCIPLLRMQETERRETTGRASETEEFHADSHAREFVRFVGRAPAELATRRGRIYTRIHHMFRTAAAKAGNLCAF